jgi:serine/threonine-protein kinase TTK/MPS1
MAPETLIYTNADTTQPIGEGKVVKLGKLSDIWSLGGILYLMVYGKAPFAQCQGNLQKAMLITNRLRIIAYPSTGVGGVHVPSGCIKTLKACLTWDQFQRPDIETLLRESDQLFCHDLKLGARLRLVKSIWEQCCMLRRSSRQT